MTELARPARSRRTRSPPRRAARRRRRGALPPRPTAIRSSSPRCSRPGATRCRRPCATRCWRALARLLGAGAAPARGGRGRPAAARASWLLEALAARRSRGARGMPGLRDAAPGRRRRLPARARPPGGRGARCPDRRRVELHRAGARGARRAGSTADPARLAHHAEAPATPTAVLRFAPCAAERAASVGAHREAAAQYARALRVAARSTGAARAELLERRAYECYLTDQNPTRRSPRCEEALGAATAGRRRARRGRRACARLSRLPLVPRPRASRGRPAVRRPSSCSSRSAPSRELGVAYGNLASLGRARADGGGGVAGPSARSSSREQLDDLESGVYALAHARRARGARWAGLRRRRARAEPRARPASAASARARWREPTSTPACGSLRQRRIQSARRAVSTRGLAYCSERGLELGGSTSSPASRWPSSTAGIWAEAARTRRRASFATRRASHDADDLRADRARARCARGAATPIRGRSLDEAERAGASRAASCRGSGRSPPPAPRRPGWRATRRRDRARPPTTRSRSR